MPYFEVDHITRYEFVVRHRKGTRIVVERVRPGPKGKRAQEMPVVGEPKGYEDWHQDSRYPRRSRRPRQNPKTTFRQGDRLVRMRSLYASMERKNARITALGREHARIERTFANVLRRALQAQQRTVLRAIRSA